MAIVLTGTVLALDIRTSDKVEDVKAKIEQAEGIPPVTSNELSSLERSWMIVTP